MTGCSDLQWNIWKWTQKEFVLLQLCFSYNFPSFMNGSAKTLDDFQNGINNTGRQSINITRESFAKIQDKEKPRNPWKFQK